MGFVMSIKSLVLVAVAACLTSGSALAHSSHYARHGDRFERRDWRDDRYDRGYRHHRQPYYGHYHPRMHRGDMLPRHYWGRDHWVGNWRRHALPRPPYGYNWVRIGPDYVLVDAYTGRVVQVVIRR